MRRILFYLLPLLLLTSTAFADINITYINTTVILNQTTTAKVVETYLVSISNSSIPTYIQDRQSVNLTIGNWSQALNTNLLIQHIFNPQSSIARFTFLPGPIINQYGGNAEAILTMSYIAYNVTTYKNVAPRKFDYSFDSSALNFQHTLGGESLPQNTRFNIIIPSGTEVVSLYPAPDYPYPNFLGNYNNVTEFSWYDGEPLDKFTFSYLVTESLQSEVVNYFNNLYYNYTSEIYLFIIILASIFSVYIYVRVFA